MGGGAGDSGFGGGGGWGDYSACYCIHFWIVLVVWAVGVTIQVDTFDCLMAVCVPF